MNKNKFLLGIFMAVLMLACSAFFGNIPTVSAVQITEPGEVEQFNPGTFGGEGNYAAGDSIVLNASPNWDCDFLYWMEVDEDGNQIESALSQELEYTFVTDQDITIIKDGQTFIISDNEGNEIKRIAAKWAKVGEFVGNGWYENGTPATLNATMYPGYEFTSWIEVDVNGEFVSELSTQPSYLLNVSKSMYVRATWARKEYNVTFNNLSDFECNVTNEVQEFGANYYNEQLTIEVAVNSNIQDLYVVELFSNNISINNQNIVDIITGENLMRVDCEIDNERKMGDKKTGFNSLVITLNICEDVDISLDYKYLYKLEIKSGNHVNIDNLKSIETVEEGGSVETHFTQVLNNKDAGNSSIYYEQIDKYIYLVEENQNITIIQSAGNNIYQFAGAKFNDNEIENDPSNKNNTYNQEITSHTIFWIYYEEVEYTISFSSYIKNLSNDYYDGLGQSVYNIPDIIRFAGQGIELSYNASSKLISIEYADNKYDYNYESVPGYEFVGFKVGNEQMVADSDNGQVSTYSYNLSAVNPENAEIQILFKYIEYTYEIRLVNDFFADGVEYQYISYLHGNNTPGNKVVVGSQILLQANTTKYAIKGWSDVETPSEEDYKEPNEGSTDSYSECIVEFIPISDDTSRIYIIYLDLTYKYLEEITFNLSSYNIERYAIYDKVLIDMATGVITFTNSNYAEEGEGVETYTFGFVINQAEIDAIDAGASTHDLNIYSESIYNNTNGYSSSFGIIETIIDPETQQPTEVYTEIFKDVVVNGLSIDDGLNVQEEKNVETVSRITYMKGTKNYTSFNNSGNLAVVKTETEYYVDGRSEYTFDKYRYFGELQAGVIEYLTVIGTVGGQATSEVDITAFGTLFNNENLTGKFNVEICKSTVEMLYNNAAGRYEFRFNNYTACLYKTEGESGEYDYIVMSNIVYHYNATESRFELVRSMALEPVGGEIVRDSEYSVIIRNLLPDHLIVYSTTSIDTQFYQISIITNENGASLRWFDCVVGEGADEKTYHATMLAATYTSQVNVEYFKLEQKIIIEINKSAAYSYTNISVDITRDGQTLANPEWDPEYRTIAALDGDVIVITIIQGSVSRGYKFENIEFLGEEQTILQSGSEYSYEFDMSGRYQNQTIFINFSAIEYTINVNYYDQEGNHADSQFAGVFGELWIDGSVRTMSAVVSIENEYRFISNPETGYYTSNAFFMLGENETWGINDLWRSNDSTDIKTEWVLNWNNFVEAIVNNADEANIVQMHIYYRIHTYNLQINFNIGGNETIVRYPTLTINNVTSAAGRFDNGKYYINQTEIFEYGSNVELKLNNIMMGTRIVNWKKWNEIVSITNVYCITNITSNIILDVNMEYIKYYLEFVYTDTEGNVQPWGVAEIIGNNNGNEYIWNQKIENNVFPNAGYVLKGQYFRNSKNEKVVLTDSYRTFDPVNFNLETKAGKPVFKIYIEFDLKTTNITFTNITTGTIVGFDGDWAINTISRRRNGETEQLTSDYQFRTGDFLIMNISTAYAGIVLNKIVVGGSETGGTVVGGIELDSQTYPNYRIIVNSSTEQLPTRNYTVEIEFKQEFIENYMQSETSIFMYFILKTYNLKFTYNLIDYKFSLPLNISRPGNEGGTSGTDKELSMNTVPYSESVYTFSVSNSVQEDFNKNFKVTGFNIPGGKYETNISVFELFWTNEEGVVNYWEQIALADYLYGGDKGNIVITLMIEPNITLDGFDMGFSNVDSGIYVFCTEYNGRRQGLSKLGDGTNGQPNVSIGGKSGQADNNFEIHVRYYYDSTWNVDAPINAGSYNIKIFAERKGNQNQAPIICDKTVSLIIATKMLVIKTSYNATNPLIKVYNDNTNVDKTSFVAGITLEGVCLRDRGDAQPVYDDVKLDQNLLKLVYESSDANAGEDGKLYTNKTIYNIMASDIALTGEHASNYKLTNAETLHSAAFKIGVIKAKPLIVKGIKAFDKTYDGTKDVRVDVSGIVYSGRLDGDNAEVWASNLKFELADVSVGVGKEVVIDYSEAIAGSDSTNYSVSFEKMYIDIYPRELQYNLQGYGIVKVVDKDGLCKIPFGAELKAYVYERGSEEYSNAYVRVEGEIQKDEKFKNYLNVYIIINGVQQAISSGLYVYLPKVEKLEQIIQLANDEQITTLEGNNYDGYTVIKVEQGQAKFAVIVSRTYIPLWLIILIAGISLLLIGVFAGVIIIIRQKSKNKYSKYNKI